MDRDQLTLAAFDKLASAYQDKFMALDLYNDTYDMFCSLMQKPKARIFEIGCGPGNITRYILSKRPDFEVEAIDISPNMIELAKKNNPGAQFKTMDCRQIHTFTDRFDAILCGFCMPYLSKEECIRLIENCALLLNSGGILYFSTIEDDYFKSGYETTANGQYRFYMYYHQQDYLQEGLKENDFTLIHLIRKQYPKPDGTQSSHMIFLAKKK